MSDAANTNAFEFRFGALKSVEQKTAASGNTYGDYVLDAGKFSVYGRIFDASILAALTAATVGDKIRVGGFIESNTVPGVDGAKDRTYKRVMTRWIQVNDGEPVKVAKAETADA